MPALRKWEAALDAFTADRVITDSEEQQQRQLSQQHGLTEADLSSLAPQPIQERRPGNSLDDSRQVKTRHCQSRRSRDGFLARMDT
jgi:hypothetical protein